MRYSSNEILMNMKNNSIEKRDKVQYKVIKRVVLPMVSLASIAIILTSCSNTINEVTINKSDVSNNDLIVMDDREVSYESSSEEYKKYNYDLVRDSMYIYTDQVRLKFSLCGVDMNNLSNNEVTDYQKVEKLNERDIFKFYEYSLYNKSETEMIIKALGYENWNDFLIKNGYVDEENKPSIKKWKEDYYQQIYDELVGQEKVKIK